MFKPGERVGRIYKPVRPDSGRLPDGSGAIALRPGPHLILDDYLVESSHNVTRKAITLKRDPRISNPVITGARANGDRNCQPFLNCLRDPQTGCFRFWYSMSLPTYGTGPSGVGLGYLESIDGINWERPHRQLRTSDDTYYGVGVIDEGSDFPDAELEHAANSESTSIASLGTASCLASLGPVRSATCGSLSPGCGC